MDERIRTLLHEARDIAVVGISDRPDRPSHDVASYLQSAGYRVIPINPVLSEVLGERCYPSLAAYGKPVDVVDIFRKPEAVPPVVEEALSVGTRAVWMQEGIRHPESAAKAQSAGVLVVEDLCIKKVLMALGGRP
ncbi:MAG: CoA-binding protein [Acidobacteriota bacterium]